MKSILLSGLIFMLLLPVSMGQADTGIQVSDATEECLDCHASFHPGIVAGWRQSRHASVSPGSTDRLTGTEIPQAFKATSVGCAECHGLRPAAHADTFEHNGYEVHVVVTPDDCAVCHKEERGQFYENIMANAYGNLADNTLYQDLQRTIIGTPQWKDGRLTFSPANAMTRDQACYYCHGTRLKVTTLKTRDTDAGELSFPVIEGWPNQGVGRINPDNSQGACSACHPRHTFSMAMARKPDTCKECHKGPDVPAYKIYEISKHGHIYETTKDTWSFENRPWTAGNDFIAPTCAACHISEGGEYGWRGSGQAHPSHQRPPGISHFRSFLCPPPA